ncbi:MAG: N,N-dimethylformamidase beta subunit family domain-containing protein [Acidimicrobiales bacterium]
MLPGEPVALHASGRGGAVDIEVVRDGLRPEVVWRAAGVRVLDVPLADDSPERGCGWDVTTIIPTDATWPSGLYVVRLGAADRPSAWFVIRSPQPSADRVLLVLSTNTWNAYNDFGGRNLYTGAVVLSFERPLAAGLLAKPTGAGERVIEGRAYAEYTRVNELSLWHGMSGWAGQERRFALWAEAEGIALDYAINSDLEQAPSLLDGYAVYISVGHDEYWTWGMRDAVEAFGAAGGRAAFLSGNTCYWQVRLEGHTMVCYKHRFVEDPVHGSGDTHLTTTIWSDPLTKRPEATMTGLSFTRGGYAHIARSVPRGSGGYEIHRPGHWLLAGTRLQRGDILGAPDVIVGYECDGCDLALVDGLPVATGAGGTPSTYEVVASAPATPFDRHTTPLPLAPGGDYELEFHARRLLGDDSAANCERLRHGHAVLGTYTRGGTVVSVGCTEWAYGLGDPVVAQITRNILGRAGTG